jgi:hypothetical protein
MMAFDSCTSEKNVRPEPEYTAVSSDNVPSSPCILHLEN